MKAVIAVDLWKQQIFTRLLTEDGWTFEVGKGLTPDTRNIYVEYPADAVGKLTECVRRCEAAAREQKKRRWKKRRGG